MSNRSQPGRKSGLPFEESQKPGDDVPHATGPAMNLTSHFPKRAGPLSVVSSEPSMAFSLGVSLGAMVDTLVGSSVETCQEGGDDEEIVFKGRKSGSKEQNSCGRQTVYEIQYGSAMNSDNGDSAPTQQQRYLWDSQSAIHQVLQPIWNSSSTGDDLPTAGQKSDIIR